MVILGVVISAINEENVTQTLGRGKEDCVIWDPYAYYNKPCRHRRR